MFVYVRFARCKRSLAQTQLHQRIAANRARSAFFDCAPRIGSGALALPMSGMAPKLGNKRSNRAQTAASVTAKAGTGTAVPEAAPPIAGPAVQGEAETSQSAEAAPSEAQAETSAPMEPSSAQAAEPPPAENGQTPKKAPNKKPGRASPGSVHSAPAMPPRDKGKGKGKQSLIAPATFPQPAFPLQWQQDPYGNWWYCDGHHWWMGYRTSSGAPSGPQPLQTSQASSGWTKITGDTWVNPNEGGYAQPPQAAGGSSKKSEPKKGGQSKENPKKNKDKGKDKDKKDDKKKQESKKPQPTKEEPPDGGDEPDWDGDDDDDGDDGDSEYTYEYIEEGRRGGAH